MNLNLNKTNYQHRKYMFFHNGLVRFGLNDRAKHAIPKWCTGRKWHIPMASNRKKSGRQIGLTKWDKVKAHDTLIDWYTGREWLLNCMTVISAWWRSNMPFRRLSGRLSGRLNYYITRWRQEVSELGDQRRRRQDVVEKATARRRERSEPSMELEIRRVRDEIW